MNSTFYFHPQRFKIQAMPAGVFACIGFFLLPANIAWSAEKITTPRWNPGPVIGHPAGGEKWVADRMGDCIGWPLLGFRQMNSNRCSSVQLSQPVTDSTKTLFLWNGRAPIDQTQFEKADTRITLHQPTKPNGTAIVICPGGGYGGLVTGAEGHGIAKWLGGHGITGIVLEYRLPKGRPYVPLLDAQRTLRTVRTHAKAWGVHPDRIGIMGFSAGGHLAATAGTHFDQGTPAATDPVNRVSCRPNFTILVYPVITMGPLGHAGSRRNLLGNDPSAELVDYFSIEKQVTVDTPPTFLAHALDDKPVPPENSRMLQRELKRQKIPVQYLQLPRGGHGLNGYKGPMWDAWQRESIKWLSQQKLLTP
jgi:acetyl esterase/lipase